MSRRRPPAPDPPPPARVEITLGNHQVVIEAPEPLETVLAAARNLWHDTGAGRDPHTGGEQVGFAMPLMSDAVDQTLSFPEIPLPHRLIPQQENPDDRNT